MDSQEFVRIFRTNDAVGRRVTLHATGSIHSVPEEAVPGIEGPVIAKVTKMTALVNRLDGKEWK